jgi:hypothetical protein
MKEITIKADELTSLFNYLDSIPHKYAKEIEGFINSITIRRAQEAQDTKAPATPE